MKQETLLSENFTGYIKVPYAQGPIAVFENPSASELREIINEKIEINNPYTIQAARRTGHVRFIVAIGKNKVYAFSAECLHKDVGEFVGYPANMFSAKSLPLFLFSGEATYEPESGKMKYFYSDNLAFQSKAFIERMSKMDWSFADKYFTEPVGDIIKKIVPKNSIYITKKKLDDTNKKLAGKLNASAKEKAKEALGKVKERISNDYSTDLKKSEKKLRREISKKINHGVAKEYERNGKDAVDDLSDRIGQALPSKEKMGKGNKVPIPRAVPKTRIKNPAKKQKIVHKPEENKKENRKRA